MNTTVPSRAGQDPGMPPCARDHLRRHPIQSRISKSWETVKKEVSTKPCIQGVGDWNEETNFLGGNEREKRVRGLWNSRNERN